MAHQSLFNQTLSKVNNFKTIYQLFKDNVYTIAYRYLSHRQNALDVSQDVFLKIHQNLEKLPPENELAPYIYRMTANRCIDILRKVVPLPLSDSILPSVEEKQIPGESEDEVNFLLSGLNPDQRMAIILKEIMGLSINEIAATCEVDTGTIKSRLSRGRETMRKTFERRTSVESRY